MCCNLQPGCQLLCWLESHMRTMPMLIARVFGVSVVSTPLRYSLAPARGYVESIHQLYAMRDAGLVKAGAENLFNIAYGDRW